MRARPPAIALLVSLVAFGCATKPRSAPPPAVVAPPAPARSNRLPDSIACESDPAGGAGRPTGSLSKEVIDRIASAHRAEMKACYDAIAATHPSTEGRVMARFAIAPSGAVETSCLVTSSLNDARVDRCVLDRLLGWRFPAPAGGGWVVVTYPFVFVR